MGRVRTAKKKHKLVAQKVKKGYQLVSGGKSTKATKSTKPKPGAKPVKSAKATAQVAPTTGAYNAALAKVIDADPDETQAWSVYADWLQSQGDPRGELGVVQERLRVKPKDSALASAERKLLKQHASTLVGDLAQFMLRSRKRDLPGVLTKPDDEPDDRQARGDEPPVRVLWRGGFFQQVFVGFPGYDWSPGGRADNDEVERVTGTKLVLDVLASPVARFLTSLRLGMPQPGDGGPDYGPLIKKLVGHDAMSRLRSLYIGDITQDESECSWIKIGDISKLYPSLEHLRSLTLRGGSELELGAIALPDLRSLTIITGGLDKKNIAAICAAKWPELERLELWFGSKDYGGNATPKEVATILSGKPFPKLKHLGLRNCEFVDDLAAAITSAPVLEQIESLDLSKGTMTETGVKALAAGKATLSHLRRLDLSDNYLGEASTLAATIMRAVCTQPQRTANGSRYVALGE